MGWARTFLLGDIGNRLDIADSEREITRLRRKLQDQRHTDDHQDKRIARLESQVESLQIALGAAVRLLVSEGVVEHEAIIRMADELDAEEDGPEDARP